MKFKCFLPSRTYNSQMCCGKQEEYNMHGISRTYLAVEMLCNISKYLTVCLLVEYSLGILSRVSAPMKSECFLFVLLITPILLFSKQCQYSLGTQQYSLSSC